MDVVVLSKCEKEIADFPPEIIGEVLDCIAKLKVGLMPSMPLSRSMPSIAKSAHELRLKDRSGQYRVIYLIKKADAIYLVHAFKKKTRQTSQKNIETALQRIKSI